MKLNIANSTKCFEIREKILIIYYGFLKTAININSKQVTHPTVEQVS
jgi:hypothetical protein